MAVPIVSELADMFAATDAGAMTTMMAKLSVEKYLSSRLDETRQSLHARCGGRERAVLRCGL